MITVAIPTLARSGYALDALRSVANQTCTQSFEVLVLDNGCDERLAAQVRAVAAEVTVPVRYTAVPAIGLHNARHAAVRLAGGDILVYVDDDVIAAPGWLTAIADAFADETVHMVGGPQLPIYEAPVPPWLEAFWTRNADGTGWCGSLTLIDLGRDQRVCDPLLIWGANLSIRKETLIRVGGFHPDGLPWHLRRFRGDGETAVSEAVAALGLRAVYSPAAMVYHRVPQDRLTEKYFQRRAFLQGISDSFSVCRGSDRASITRVPAGRLRHRIQRVTSALRRALAATAAPDSWAKLQSGVQEAHAAGYAYHQTQVENDLTVRDWCLRLDYWEAEVPVQEAALAPEFGELG
jgi:glycosyltransferase involved in cell wall biosynthesis